MKIRNLLSCGLAAAALLLPTACAEEYASTSSGEKVPLRLTAGTAPVTRAATNIQSTVFDAGETINAYITATDGTVIGAPTVYTTETASGGINPLTPAVQPYFPQDPAQKLDIYALYPPTVTSGTTAFTVCADQREDADYKSSDLMWASQTDVTRGTGVSTTALLPFTHKMVKLVVEAIVEDAVRVGTVTGVRLKNVYRRIGLNAQTGVLDATALADQGDILLSDDGTANACMLPPQSIRLGDFIEVTTSKGTAAFALALESDKAFAEGHYYKVIVHLGAQNMKEVATIDAWPDGKNILEVEALGAGNIQIDPIDDIDLTATPAPVSPYVPASVVVRSSGEELTPGTDYTLEYFNNTTAGYAVVVATGIGTYAGKTAARTYLIKQGAAEITTAPTAINRTYDGTTQNLVTAGAAQAVGAAVPVKYCLTQNGYYTTAIPQATNAGTYTVWYRVDATDTYSGIDPQKVEVTIQKATFDAGDITPPTPRALTYNERYQQLVTAGSATGNVPMTYSLSQNGTYSTDIPTAINAGTYTVWYQVGDDNHYGSDPASVEVTIQKADGRISISPTSLLFDISDRKGVKKIITVNRDGDGAITASSDNITDVSISVSDNKITVERLTETEGTATITVNVAEGTNNKAKSTNYTVTLNKCTLHLNQVKTTDQKYIGYLVSTTGYVYPPTEDGVAVLQADGGTAAGVITYVGKTNTTHGFVMALHDSNNGATCTFDQAPSVATAYTPTISGHSWKLGSKDEYQTAVSSYNTIVSVTGNYWDALVDYHWTSTSGSINYPNYSSITFQWIYERESFRQNITNFFIYDDYIPYCKVRPLFSF